VFQQNYDRANCEGGENGTSVMNLVLFMIKKVHKQVVEAAEKLKRMLKLQKLS